VRSLLIYGSCLISLKTSSPVDAETEGLLREARRWLRANDCQLPLDKYFQLVERGIDVSAIEEQELDDDGER